MKNISQTLVGHFVAWTLDRPRTEDDEKDRNLLMVFPGRIIAERYVGGRRLFLVENVLGEGRGWLRPRDFMLMRGPAFGDPPLPASEFPSAFPRPEGLKLVKPPGAERCSILELIEVPEDDPKPQKPKPKFSYKAKK